jgi:FKBP-type peptidyl-prolyl cis-trans isomerase FkpA
MLRRVGILLLISGMIFLYSCDKDEDYLVRDKQIIEDYLKAHSIKASSTPEGIYYVIDSPGSNDHPTQYSTIKVHYKGYLTDGTVFDQTNGTAATLRLYQTIAGWQIGIPVFGKGGKGKLLIPSDYGYGAASTDEIPARSVLIFDIVLSDFY